MLQLNLAFTSNQERATSDLNGVKTDFPIQKSDFIKEKLPNNFFL